VVHVNCPCDGGVRDTKVVFAGRTSLRVTFSAGVTVLALTMVIR